MAIKAPKGTKDMMPEDAYKWHYIEDAFFKICDEYGFGELRTPIFEDTNLFNRGVGETTDIVQKEMYTFEDLGHRSITLKPEGTSPAVRAFIESKHFADMQPSKYCYNTPCFRYEKPQAGRLRQFHQFGIENFGASSMMADAEIIAMADDFLKRMGIDEIELHINSVGCRECRTKYRKALQDFLRPHYDELCSTCQSRFETNPMRILDCKSKDDQEIVKDAPLMVDYLCDDCKEHFEKLQEYLSVMGIEFDINPKIVRGLDYYTRTVFEFITDEIGAQGTVCGGGRYDGLIEQLGGKPTPALGFGLGLERLLMVMDAQGCDYMEPKTCDLYIVPMGEDALKKAMGIASELREEGCFVEYDLIGKGLNAQMKYANKTGAKFVMVLGDNEIESGVAKLKNMATGEQTDIRLDNTIAENFSNALMADMFKDIDADIEKFIGKEN